MIVKISLSSSDVQNILLEHIKKVCGLPVPKGHTLDVLRVGESPPAFEGTVEVVRIPPDARG